MRANTLRGQEAALLAGYSVGDYCFGYKSAPVPGSEQTRRGRKAKLRKVYAIDPESAVWVVRLFHWFVHKQRSLRWIIRELIRQGAPKDHRATAPDWHHQYLPGLLSKPQYRGTWPWGKKTNVRNPLTGRLHQEERREHECEKWVRSLVYLELIDEETFRLAQELLQKNAEKYGRHRDRKGTLRDSPAGPDGRSSRHLLAQLIRCGECGALLRRRSQRQIFVRPE